MKISERPFVGISRRGKEIAFPDPGIAKIRYRPYAGGFQGVEVDTPITHLLTEGKVRGIILDPSGLNPEAIVQKLKRVDAYIRDRSRRGIDWHCWLVLLTEYPKPGELFHSDTATQAILSQRFLSLKVQIVPPTSTAMEAGFLLRYLPQGTTDEELVKEYQATLNEMARAFEDGDTTYLKRLERWANLLVDTRLERLGGPIRTSGVGTADLASLCKQMQTSQ